MAAELSALPGWRCSVVFDAIILGLEIIVLRHQVSVLKRRNKRPRANCQILLAGPRDARSKVVRPARFVDRVRLHGVQ